MTNIKPKRMDAGRSRQFRYDDNRDSRAAAGLEDMGFCEEDRTNDAFLRSLAGATNAALQRLTERQREAVVMFYFEGVTQREIARRWEISPSAVSRLLSRAIAKLRSLIIVK